MAVQACREGEKEEIASSCYTESRGNGHTGGERRRNRVKLISLLPHFGKMTRNVQQRDRVTRILAFYSLPPTINLHKLSLFEATLFHVCSRLFISVEASYQKGNRRASQKTDLNATARLLTAL
jgi:hypothetical protein